MSHISVQGNPFTSTETNTLIDVAQGGASANQALSNLSSVAINAALVLGTSDAFALGSATKMWSDLFLASGAVINFNNGNVTLTHSAGVLTLGGTSTLALGSNSLTLTGSISATGARVTKGWFTDVESTNMYTVGDISLSSTFAPLTAPTFATSITGSYLTASEILGTDASKNIVSLAVATYPSLTELSYVKGVTSALQTQLGLKSPLASPTFTGTVTIPTPFTLGAVSVTTIGTQLNYFSSAGGTTGTTSTNIVFSTSPTFITPTLGVASSTSLATSAATPLLLTNGQLVNIALTSQTVGATTLTIPDFASVVDEFTFKTKSQTMSNKTFVTPALGTPASGVMTNVSGTAASLTAGNVTTNANLTGHVTSTGNAAILGAFTIAQLNTAVSDADVAILGANTFTGVQTLTSATPQLILGVNVTTLGSIKLFGNTSGDATIQSAAVAGTATVITLPAVTSTLATLAGTETLTNKTLTSPTLTTPALGTPASGTLTNATGLPAAAVLAGSFGAGAYVISTSLQAATIELGHATDTTLVRVSAGVVSIEGVNIADISSAQTITNKRIEPRVVSAASYTTDTGTSLSVATTDIFVITAQAGALLFNNPGGTAVQGQKLVIRIKDNATARALTWGIEYRAMGTALPSTTVLSKTLYLGFFYNSTDTKWDLVASAQEA